MKVNKTALYCWSLFGLQGPTHTFLDLIQNNGKYNYSMWVTWIGHKNGIFLTIYQQIKGRTL